jgi:Zn-dependent protease
MQIQTLLLIAPPILVALTFHEYAHAYVAHRFGDDTAKENGRLSLNPLRHLDVMGTIMIFLVHFGWAKPVPINPNRLKNPKKDMLWISAAGPLANMILALVSGLLLRVFFDISRPTAQHPIPNVFSLILLMSMQINLALAIFNILPIAPLDGSKILSGMLPDKYARIFFSFERYGPFVLLALIILGRITGISLLGRLVWPFVKFFSTLFAGL